MNRAYFPTSLNPWMALFVWIWLICLPTQIQGQRNRKNADRKHPIPWAEALVDTTFSNGLHFLAWLQPGSGENVANFHWDYKPPLQHALAGLDELTALYLIELALDSIKDNTVVMGANPSATSELRLMAVDSSFYPALHLALEHWKNPHWSKAELKTVRQIQKEAWNRRTQSNRASAAYLLNHLIYTSAHPLGETNSGQALDSLSQDLIQEHYHRFYQPNTCTLTVVVRERNDDQLQAISNSLASWKAHEVQNSTVIVPGKPNRNEVSFIHDADAEVGHLSAGHLIRIQPDHPDALIGKMLASWVTSCMDQQESFSTKSSAVFAPHELHGTWTISTDSIPVSQMSLWVDAVKIAMQTPMDSIFSDFELDSIKTEYMSVVLEQCQQPMPWDWLDEGRPDTWLQCNREHLQNTLDQITPRDVLRVANAHLRPMNMHIAAVGNEQSILDAFSSYELQEALNKFDRQAQPISRYDPAPENWTAQTVISNFYEACGGESKYRSVRSCLKKGTMSGQRGMKLDLEIQEIYGLGHHSKFALDGQVMMEHHITLAGGFTNQMGREIPLSTDEFLRKKPVLYPDYLNQLQALEAEAQLLGSTSVDGSRQWVVELTRNGEVFQTLFFDEDTHLLNRMVEERFSPTGPIKVITAYAGYTPFDGILFPMHIAQITRDEQVIITFEEIKPNARIDQSLFK